MWASDGDDGLAVATTQMPKPLIRSVELIVQPNEVNEVSYMSPKAGADKTWVPKASFVTAVAGLGCGVGYYK